MDERGILFIIIIVVIIIIIVFIYITPPENQNINFFDDAGDNISDVSDFTSVLNGKNLNNPVCTNAIGLGKFEYIKTESGNTLLYRIYFNGLNPNNITKEGSLVIVDSDNAVLKILSQGTNQNNLSVVIGGWLSGDVDDPLTDDIVNKLINNKLFIKLRNKKYPNGQIGGKIILVV